MKVLNAGTTTVPVMVLGIVSGGGDAKKTTAALTTAATAAAKLEAAEEAITEKTEEAVNIAEKITGYRFHGLAQAMGRDGGRGVSPKAILDTVRNPAKIVEQVEGKMKYVGNNAAVILNKIGQIITTYAKNSNGLRGVK